MRTSTTDIENENLPGATRFEFFQAVRLLQNFLESGTEKSPDVDVVCAKLDDEHIKFKTAATKRFPVSEIVNISSEACESSNRNLTELEVSFFGLFGAISALPWHDSERAITQAPFREFLSVFNHRLIALFYRAWEKNHFFVGFEKSSCAARDSQLKGDLTELMYATIGMHSKDRRKELDFPTDPLLRHLLMLAQSSRSSIGLRKTLSAFFPDDKISILEFNQTFLKLEPNQCTRMDSRVDDTSSMLGVGTILGSKVADYSSKFRVRIGPIGFNEFRAFLPGRKRFKELKQIVRFIVGGTLDFDIQFVVRKDDIPPVRLDSNAEQFKLGQNMWLSSLPFNTDKSDPVFDVYN